jgi:hypothetical protein
MSLCNALRPADIRCTRTCFAGNGNRDTPFISQCAAEISQRIVCPGCSSKSWASLSVGDRSENTRPLECPAKGGAALPSGLALPLPFSLFERRRNKAFRAKSVTRCLGMDIRQEETRGDP